MATVNPPPIPRMPERFFNDPNARAYFDAITRIIFQLWVNSSSGTIGSEAGDSSLSKVISSLYAAIYEVEPYVHTQASDYTTVGNEFIEITSSSVITANSDPEDLESVTIYINGGTGSTFTDGTNTDTFLVDGTVLTYRYYVDIDEWVRGG